jgi:hypothetical protein
MAYEEISAQWDAAAVASKRKNELKIKVVRYSDWPGGDWIVIARKRVGSAILGSAGSAGNS